ncbi:hypothetical protein TRAPUB_7899 [Trametes pubescens]|uniref:Uncharacterized protein n=1 Tax=Trametes pubescens TaxID=154538 RepID=A0A1M2V230_TRAPU|nr:hypothetical protein TRAPUB_7899 [Trametes pubescens]
MGELALAVEMLQSQALRSQLVRILIDFDTDPAQRLDEDSPEGSIDSLPCSPGTFADDSHPKG